MSAFLDKVDSLTPLAKRILCDKATEYPFSGQYNPTQTHGTYLCRRCGLALFRASSQFASSCGWPSFDDEIPDSIAREPDADGHRIEILCSRCHGHLGHVFTGEGLTSKNLRHCVNAASIDFVNDGNVLDTQEAIVAGGCFWGVEHYLKQLTGVVGTEVGYIGGHIDDPYYDLVCSGNTGHFEAVRVLYDVSKTNYEAVLTRFFEIHDPTQATGQGPDRGSQYLSAVFYFSDEQKQMVEQLIDRLKANGYQVTTKLLPVTPFWPAEAYHQQFYEKHNQTPYCHLPVERFKK